MRHTLMVLMVCRLFRMGFAFTKTEMVSEADALKGKNQSHFASLLSQDSLLLYRDGIVLPSSYRRNPKAVLRCEFHPPPPALCVLFPHQNKMNGHIHVYTVFGPNGLWSFSVGGGRRGHVLQVWRSGTKFCLNHKMAALLRAQTINGPQNK